MCKTDIFFLKNIFPDKILANLSLSHLKKSMQIAMKLQK